jgi:hypothetical protein
MGAADADEARTALDAEENTAARAQLSRWRFNLNATTAPIIGLCGDSMIDQSQGNLKLIIGNYLGTSGIAFNPAVPGGGAVAINDSARWFTKDGARLSASGQTGSLFDNSGISSQPANTLKLYYITQPGGGTFKVQTKKNTGSWTDEAAHLTVSTSGTLGSAVITITKTDFRAVWDIRAVWVSGSVDIIGGGAYHTNMLGARTADLNAGGGAGNMVDWVTMPAAIAGPVFNDIGLDLVIFSHLDGASAVNDYQATWQDLINAAGEIAVSNITATASLITINTAAAHGLSTGNWFQLVGTSNALYNGKWFIVDGVTDSDTVTVASQLNAGAATGGTIRNGPTWLCVGPPMGYDDTEQTARLAQAAAMKSLAATRGDAYWDNNRWAVSPEYALAAGLLFPGDVHYTDLARRNWNSKMVNDTGLFITPDRLVLGENLQTFKGGIIRRFRGANLGAATLQGNEHVGDFRICAPDGGTGGILYLENVSGPASQNDGGAIFYDGNGFALGPIGSTAWRFRHDVGTGAALWSASSTVDAPNGVLGRAAEPIRSIIFGKTITATGTTAAQTINKVTGSVNFAAGDASKVVTNSLAIAPTSGQTGSIIVATVRTNDATMKSVAVVCSSNGSFTLDANAVPTGEVRVDFAIITP